MQRIANPRTPVRFRPRPPFRDNGTSRNVTKPLRNQGFFFARCLLMPRNIPWHHPSLGLALALAAPLANPASPKTPCPSPSSRYPPRKSPTPSRRQRITPCVYRQNGYRMPKPIEPPRFFLAAHQCRPGQGRYRVAHAWACFEPAYWCAKWTQVQSLGCRP